MGKKAERAYGKNGGRFMSRSRDSLWQIAFTLQHYGIIPHLTEEMIQRACERLRQQKRGISTRGRVFMVLDLWVVPDRLVARFDPEIDNCEEAVQVISHYARATAGEWVPASVFATVLSQEDGRTEAIDFDFRGTHFHWSFQVASREDKKTDWATCFYERLVHFFQKHLEGEFFFTGSLYEDPSPFPEYYLPRQAVADLNAIAEQIEEQYGFEGGDAFVADL
jgi:hypothetical protein